ncbi:radical SAM/SPASM domain-containing protein [Neobacillus notoginsengisoli]|uniref:radical SAM/SPASM domain-containing protein n=1 Tax=Neobacillus notoginsengisoli TaxID=1578198 RepID=UPI0013147712|nr:radical SAM protein [Neobacillus notoginsengisoli]
MERISDSVVAYTRKNQFIVHNFILNSWIVVDEDQIEFVKENIINGLPGFSPETKKIENLIKLYKLAQTENEIPSMSQVNIPKVVYFVATYNCNINCIYCYAEAGPARKLPNEMKTDETLKTISELKDIGIETIVFTGGEVSLRKDLFTLLTHAKNIGLKANIISNGSFIRTREIAEKLANLCNLITISLDSLDEEEHDKNRGKNSWNNAKTAIDLLLEAGASIKINQTVTLNNKDAIDKLRVFTDENNIRLNVVPFGEMGRGKEKQDFALQVSDRLQIELDSTRNRMSRNETQIQPFIINQHCGFGIGEFSIDLVGDVYLCKLLHTPKLKAGNVREQPIKDIITNSAAFNKARNSRVDNLKKCKDCTFKYLCAGGCRGLQYELTSNLDGVDHTECDINKELLLESMWLFFNRDKELKKNEYIY